MHINLSGKVEPTSTISPFFMLTYSSEYVLLPKKVHFKGRKSEIIIASWSKNVYKKKRGNASKYLLIFTHLLIVV